MATVKFYLDKRRQKKDGTYPIKLNVFHNKQIMIATQLSASEKEWNGNEYSVRAQNYKPRNIVARGIINKAETVIFTLEQQEKLKSTTDKALKKLIEDAISSKVENQKTFLYYLDEFVSKKTNQGTKSIYTTTRNKIEEYDSHCTFESMDKSWLENFEAWMAKTMKVNAYAIHLRNIRSVFNYAIDEEYTTLYPFRRFSIKKEETRKRSLTAEQLRLLRDYPCEEYQIRYRDMFMLMFYLIGVNAADLFNAKHSALVNGRFEYKRAKTGKLYSIKVEPEAQAIIEKYKGKDYLLNIMDEYGNYKDFLHRMGIGLKQIGETERKGLGGKKSRNPLFPDLSSYWARHTWATVAAELDVPKEVIAHALGHSWANSTTTDIYIRFDMKKVDEANRKVIDFVNNINV
ncbi:site-specific integrase [Bacteroides stercoris]|jgi:site-specific recombinase XerD|uniref:Site-specific recombinase, phage integrase family n=1 Tax=Bacteroides stercoris ATCC 43183 TaxID=449673 RepID=B0NM83_BACSE|nr:site-specific integrase [Bacteroides stercoris]EDS16455.1 site-specific recombinase, phage integrase family [Bacteroides stercoris ATCC 43183]UWO02692.1 site-specific integrase [Bacteroides stercoris ATCC 43183]SDX42861.1 Site-specific recombinase XerD [Bacteroides stercoris]